MPISNIQWATLHPAMLVLELGRSLRSTIFALLLGGYFAFKGQGFLLLMILFFSVFLPAIGIALRFMSYRYALDGGHLLIREGVLSKKERSIPITRIHNINTTQSLAARLFGVVRVDIETAGGGQAEASMPAISMAAAEALERSLVPAKDDIGAEERPKEELQPLFSMSLANLVVLGATTNRLGVIFAGLYAASEYFEQDFVRAAEEWASKAVEFTTQFQARSGLEVLLTIIVSTFIILSVSWVISITLAIVQFYGFTLAKSGSDLKIRSGLFTLRSFTVPAGKIQALRFKTSAIRRPLRLLQIKVQSAGFMGVQEPNQQSQSPTNLLAPLTKHSMVNYFVQLVWPQADWSQLVWQSVHPYTRGRQFRILWFLFGVGCFAIGATTAANWVWLGVLWVALALPSWLVAHLTYKQIGYVSDGEFLYLKTGFVGLQYWVIPLNRIQVVEVRQNPFQRRWGLASLVIDVAGQARDGAAVIPNISIQKAWSMFNRFAAPKAVV